jgi:Ca-activated chloride channel family protein
MGMAPYPVQTPFGIQYQDMEVEIDEALLTQMADMTGGKYFRATDNKKLREIYQEIDKMEKTITAFKEYRKRKEEFFPVLLIAALVFGAELMVRFLLNRNLP